MGEEDEEAEKIKQERMGAYAKKKSNKKAVIAKSMVILDVKPWDDETDMKEMEDHVRTIEMDGLLWGASNYKSPLWLRMRKSQLMTSRRKLRSLKISCRVWTSQLSTSFKSS